MTDDASGQLGAVFNELVDLVGEVKQAAWSSSSEARRSAFNELKMFLGEQAKLVDEAETRAGGRPAWVKSPTGHQARNMAAEANGDTERLSELLIRDLRAVVVDIRDRAGELDEEWRRSLLDLADNLERHIDAL